MRNDVETKRGWGSLLIDVPVWVVDSIHKHGDIGTDGGGNDMAAG